MPNRMARKSSCSPTVDEQVARTTSAQGLQVNMEVVDAPASTENGARLLAPRWNVSAVVTTRSH